MTSKQSIQFFHTLLIINYASNMQYIWLVVCGLFFTLKFSRLFTAVAVLACLRSLLSTGCSTTLFTGCSTTLFTGCNTTLFTGYSTTLFTGCSTTLFTWYSTTLFMYSVMFIINIIPLKLLSLDSILAKINESGFSIAMAKELTLSREEAEDFYAEHKDKDFFESLVSNMCRYLCIHVVLRFSKYYGCPLLPKCGRVVKIGL